LLQPFSPSRRLRLLGLLQWASCPASAVGIFLPSLYHLIRALFPKILAPANVWKCDSLSSKPVYSHPYQPAAPKEHRFRVGKNHLSRALTSWVQNTKPSRAVRSFPLCASSRHAPLHHVCIVTDSTAVFYANLSLGLSLGLLLCLSIFPKNSPLRTYSCNLLSWGTLGCFAGHFLLGLRSSLGCPYNWIMLYQNDSKRCTAPDLLGTKTRKR